MKYFEFYTPGHEEQEERIWLEQVLFGSVQSININIID